MAIDQRDRVSMNHQITSCPSTGQRSSWRDGMTLIEVMVAVTVLAIGLLAVVGQIAPINNQRQFTDDTQVAQNLLKSITERLATAPFDSLRGDSMPWTYARRLPLSDGTLPAQDAPETGAGATICQPVRPLNDNDAVGGNNLVTQGLVSRPTGLKNLQVFIEYYRTISRFTNTSVTPVTFERDSSNRNLLGLLCEANPAKPTTPAAFRALVNTPATHFSYALATTPSGATNLDTAGYDHRFDAVLIRVVITWGEGSLNYANLGGTLSDWRNNRRIEAWTGIRSATEQ